MSDLEQINVTIEECNRTIEFGEKIKQLTSLPIFKEVIEEGYFKNHASTLVMNKALPELASEEKQKAIIKSLDAIGEFRQFLYQSMLMGKHAAYTLEEHEATRTAIAKEEMGEDAEEGEE